MKRLPACRRPPQVLPPRIDALDPLEVPPYGNVDLADAKSRIGDRVCIVGGLDDMEVRDFLQEHLQRQIICECQILIDEKELRKRDLMRQFGVDLEGIELVD